MSFGLVRYQNAGDLHFITFSCVRHRPILGTPEARNTFLSILERTRKKHRFDGFAYVVMPDHVHLLVSEPVLTKLSASLQVIKQLFSRTRSEEHVWESRYYDFNVRTADKRAEKLNYIHQNPVRRGLVTSAEAWDWSSCRSYTLGQPAVVEIVRPWLSSSSLLR
jgi:putative transposase